jgi:hypothetical protein
MVTRSKKDWETFGRVMMVVTERWVLIFRKQSEKVQLAKWTLPKIGGELKGCNDFIAGFSILYTVRTICIM